MFEDLVIDSSNFDQYFFDVRKNKPKPGQVLACYDAIAEFVNGNLKQDILYLLMKNTKGGETAPRIMQKLAGATQQDAYRVVKEMLTDLLSGMSSNEVAEKPYEFRCQHFYYTERDLIPENDPHWWSTSLINMETLEQPDKN